MEGGVAKDMGIDKKNIATSTRELFGVLSGLEAEQLMRRRRKLV